MKTYWVTRAVEELYRVEATNEEEAISKLDYEEPGCVDVVSTTAKEDTDGD